MCRASAPLKPEDGLGDAVEQRRLVRYVPIQHRRISAHLVAEATHGQALDAVAVDDRQRRPQDR
jgi:hypothetical protein